MGISFYTQRDDVMCQTVSQPLLSWHVSAAHITPSSAPPGRHPRTLPPSTTHQSTHHLLTSPNKAGLRLSYSSTYSRRVG